ncbi:PREDICTED: replication factor C subunit 1-like [Amphimedon queenslandica]|uniref:Replication factor C subunit 1 n=1 Tax=Amphimedon queenslandica TaxID=400682 RepID=A0AAN0IXQ4_AMPQE|nr:PREDICTED: replication factor C subunit 1-like [Amphimedon queenslandica]|eukprot:XP_019849550.1 PREDICTED: replication factor C subunit 1-like [Amphimedon queenslandica]
MDIRGFFKAKIKEKAAIKEDEDDFKSVKRRRTGDKRKKPRPRILSDSDDEEKKETKRVKTTPPAAKEVELRRSTRITPLKEKHGHLKKPNKATPIKTKNRKEISSAEEFFGSAPVATPTSNKKSTKKEEPKETRPQDIAAEKPAKGKRKIQYIDIEEEPPAQKLKLLRDKDQKDLSTDKGHVSESPPLPPPAHIDLTSSCESVKQEPKTIKQEPKKVKQEPKKVKQEPKQVKQESKPVKQDSKPVSDVKPTASSEPAKRQKSSTPPAKSVKPVTEAETALKTPAAKRYDSYREYMNRGGPKAPGSKEIPQGAPNCLYGLTFVFTGVGESMEREEAADIVKSYGGRVTTSLSKKTNYLVVGEGAGVSKLSQAKSLNVCEIDEDGFLELIRTRPERKGVVTTPTNTGVKSRKRKGSSNEPIPVTTPPPATKRPCYSVMTPTSTLTTPTTPTTPTDLSSIPTSSFYPTTPTSTKSAKPKGPSTLLWVDKYAPASVKGIIGQQGGKSNANKLLEWLKVWHKYHGVSASTRKLTGEGVFHKAALLSGPPGIGKTTTAVLVCKELDYTFTELNASATRSRKSLQQFVTDSLSSHSMDSYITGGSQRHHVLIMDEVDGMAGNEDRGGVMELIQLIKTSRVPIICICNDRSQAKMRSLANYCFDLRFYKPKLEQIKGPMMSVAFKEGIKIKPEALNEIIISCNYDIRQVLHSLSMLAAGTTSITKESLGGGEGKTSIRKSPFDVVRKVFQPFDGQRELSLREKSDLFFTDYSLMPLFVQENYLQVKPVNNTGTATLSKIQLLEKVSSAADSIAQGDLVSRIVRSDQGWQLLPTQAIFSSILPGEYMRGGMSLPEFPQWLGNYSKTSKTDRILQQLVSHSTLNCSCNKTEFLLDYSPLLSAALTAPLQNNGDKEGPSRVVETLKDYDLTREDWEDVIELNSYSGRASALSTIDPKVKATLTRLYNKEDIKLPYSVMTVRTKRGRASLEEEEEEEREGEEAASSSGDEGDLSSLGVKAVKTDKRSSTASSSKRRKISSNKKKQK